MALGDRVTYTPTMDDLNRLVVRREQAAGFGLAPDGPTPDPAKTLTGLVVGIPDDQPKGSTAVNLLVFADGADNFYVPGATTGDAPGQYKTA